MPKPTDALGNELTEGMLVRVKMDDPSAIGRIVFIREPGVLSPIAAPGPGEQPIAMPGHIKILAEIDIAFMPGRGGAPQAMRDILAIVEPERMKKAMQEAKRVASSQA